MGYQLDPESLKHTADGINRTIGELKTLGLDGEAGTGNGFGSLELRGKQLGHQGLEQAFSQFCDRWSWGVRTLVQDANGMASALHLAAGMYNDMEHYGSGVLKDLLSDVGGNPHETDDQVENKSWGQFAHDELEQAKPDYSAQSFEHAGQHSLQTWRGETRDVLDNGMWGLPRQAVDATGHGEQMSEIEQRLLGPAPGEGGK